MKRLIVGDGHTLPVGILTDSTTIFGRKRSGKSNNAVVLVEEALDLRAQVVILDPKGDWWGMTSSFDGKAAGYPLVVLGGTHPQPPDVKLNPLGGAAAAEWILEGGYSAIVDLSLLRDADRDRFCGPFLDTIRRRHTIKPAPILVVVDEADELAPQDERERQHVMDTYRSLVWMVKRGGAFGVGTIAITQRPASLSKNVTTQSETVIVLQVSGSQDLDAVSDALKHHVAGAAKKDRTAALEDLLREIVGLEKGETVIVSASPGLKGQIHRIPFRRRRTFDSGATPEFGKAGRVRQPKVIAKIDIARLSAAMEKAVADVKANDPASLRADLVAARKRIGELEKRPLEVTVAPTKTKEVPVLRPGEVTHFERAVERVVKAAGGLDRHVSLLALVRDSMLSSATLISDSLRKASAPSAEPSHRPAPATSGSPGRARAQAPDGSAVRAGDRASLHDAGRATQGSRKSEGVHTDRPAGAAGVLRTADPSSPAVPIKAKGEIIMLRAIAQHGEAGVTREQLTVLTGYKKSSRDTYLQRLGASGAIATHNGTIFATEHGVAGLGHDFEPLPTGAALRDHWLQRLPAGESKILALLVDTYPSPMSREFITTETDYKKSSRDTYLQRLGARRLIEVVGREGVRAAAILFDGAA